ncbi:MAG: heme exporter protein CcmB [Bacteroidota bacterium]
MIVTLSSAIRHLINKDFTLELRRKSVIAGLGLYLFSTAFICYFTFSLKQNQITPLVWSALFWVTILFTAVNAVAKSFIGEKKGVELYMYSIASPHAILLSKILYNFILSSLLAFTGFALFGVLLKNPIEDATTFSIAILLASFGFASSLTLLSGIASKANNSNILMAILSFPVVISILLLVIKITKNCIDGLEWAASQKDVVTLIAINCLVTALSYLLFPYIWRS